MDASERYGADPRAFLEKMRPRIQKKLEEEIRALNGIKFQLALNVQLRKTGPDGTEEYTDPVLRHKQEALLQAMESMRHLIRSSLPSWRLSRSGHKQAQAGSLIEWKLCGWILPGISP